MQRAARGATMVEYALIIAMLTAVIAGTVYYLGNEIADVFCRAFEYKFDPAQKKCVHRTFDPG